MKNINIKKYTLYFSSILMLILACSCDNYLDVDTDTDNPTVAPLNLLLTNIEVNYVAPFTDVNYWNGDILEVYTHQMCAREEQDQYGAKADNTLTNNDWDLLYLGLNDIETLISQAETEGNKVYQGIGQILEAYMITVAVDIWGDVPFTEAIQLKEGIVSPKFDSGESIYTAAFKLLDQGKANVLTQQGLIPSSDDLFYNGNSDSWVKFANSFKLKLYNQVRKTSLYNQVAVNTLLAENNLFTSSADDFQFNHTANISPTDERNQMFQGSYGGSQITYYISPWFYEIMKGMNPKIHHDIVDPRIPYYWANQLAPGEFPAQIGDTETGNPNADYWDESTGFLTIRFGSISPNRDHSVTNVATFPGIFPCGGRYDDGQGFQKTITSGTGVAPRRMFTYDEMLYVKAEMMHFGLIPGNAQTTLKEAMIASFSKVDEVVAGTNTTQEVPTLSGTSAVTDFINAIATEFSSATPEKQLEIIITQKWVATFGDSCDQYTDYRRTGFPVLAHPNGPSPEYQLNNNDGYPLNDAYTVQNNRYQRTLFWPQNELDLNQNAPDQKDTTTYRVFWDK